VRDTVWHARGRHDQITGSRGDILLADDESGLSREHHIEFVGAGVRVNRLAVPWLETIESDQQPVGCKAVDLGHRVRAKGGALEQMLDQFWGFHGRLLAPDGRYTQRAQ
jgi:hypothetical protein